MENHVMENYIKGTFVGDALPEMEDEGCWAVITYGMVKTSRELFDLPVGTEGFLQLDVGRAMFILFNNRECSSTLMELPLADVLAPELKICERDECQVSHRKLVSQQEEMSRRRAAKDD